MARARIVLPIALVLALVGSLPTTSADHPDEDPLMHLNVDVQDLGPGQSISRPIESPEGPLRKGWVYIIYGGVEGNHTVTAELIAGNETTATFVWEPGAFHQNSTKIQKTGAHHLVLTNTGNETVRYAFYYDQSCNCAGKLIPLAGGFVLFNYDLPADTDVDLRFPLIETWELKGQVAWHDPDTPTAAWPHDFEIIKEGSFAGKGWIDLSFRTDQRGTYYVFLEALQGASPKDPVSLTPDMQVHGAPMAEASGAPLLALPLAALLVAFVLRRR